MAAKKKTPKPKPKVKSIVNSREVVNWPLDRLRHITMFNGRFLRELSRDDLERAVTHFIAKDHGRDT